MFEVSSNILNIDDRVIDKQPESQNQCKKGHAINGVSTQRDLTVCGEAATEDEALAMVQKTQPDVVLVDISLKEGNGIDVVKRIKASHPRVKMIVVSGFHESLYAERALRAGALGYLNKQESNDKVLAAIRIVLKGERFISPEITQRLINHALGGHDESKTPIDQLTVRELEVF